MNIVFYIRKFICEFLMDRHHTEVHDYIFDKNGFLIYNHPLTSLIEPYYIPLKIHKNEVI